MYKINVTLEGTAPFLFNKYLPSDSKKRPESEYMEIAKGRAYSDDHGIFVPQWTLKRVLQDGIKGAGIKEAKKSIAPAVVATTFLEAPGRFQKPDVDFVHTCMGRVPPRTGAMVAIYRPAMDVGWLLSFTYIVLDASRDPGQLHDAMIHAGPFVGIGSWRPEYGRFIIRNWDVIR